MMTLRVLIIGLVFAAVGATGGEVAQSPYGPDDEIGALNAMTAESRWAVLSRVRGGEVYDLSVENFPGMPGLVHLGMGDPAFHMWMTHTPGGLAVEGIQLIADEELALYDDALIMSSHTGTHIDTLNHVGYGDKIFNGFSASQRLGNKGWTVAGADKIPPIISRGILIDVAAAKGTQILPASYGITPDDLESALAKQGVGLQAGDSVFVRTGRMTLWPEPERYVPNTPGINLDAARWLADQGVILIGADNLTVEKTPLDRGVVHSFVFAERGVYLLENVWLEELASDAVYEFALIAAPIKIRGATGSPVRPIALPVRPE